MKNITKAVILLTLALALLLTQLACAEPSDAVRGVYDALLAEGSAYSRDKAFNAEYYPDMVYEEKLEDDGFTIAVTGSEYMDGSWTFTQDSDCLTATLQGDDFGGAMMVMNVVKAVGDCYGMNSGLLNGYIAGLSAMDLENDDFTIVRDEAAGTVAYRINIAGPWAMAALDSMVLDERTVFSGALGEDSISSASNAGKLMMLANGSASDVTILLGEYGGLDALAYESAINLARILQPVGWEDFVASYTELADAQTDGYSVTLNADAAAVAEIIEDANAEYSYAILHFGK